MARLLSRCVCLALLSVIAGSVTCLTSTSAAAPRTPGTSTIGRWLSELRGSDTGGRDFFGDSVAISGTTAVIGAQDHAHGAGRAYLFSRNQAGWSRVAVVEGADTLAGEDFGWSVAIAGDTVVVGAPSRAKDAGRAYVFGPTSAGWGQVGVLKGTGTVVNDGFGASVALSGMTAVVGASGHDDYAGAAYVFSDTAGNWHETTALEGSGVVTGDEFGWSVAVSGTTAVVGAQGHGDDGGLAYVFEKTGRYWRQTAELEGSDTVAGDFFGDSVALFGHHCCDRRVGRQQECGRVDVFEEAKGHWRQVAELKGSDTVAGDYRRLGGPVRLYRRRRRGESRQRWRPGRTCSTRRHGLEAGRGSGRSATPSPATGWVTQSLFRVRPPSWAHRTTPAAPGGRTLRCSTQGAVAVC